MWKRGDDDQNTHAQPRTAPAAPDNMAFSVLLHLLHALISLWCLVTHASPSPSASCPFEGGGGVSSLDFALSAIVHPPSSTTTHFLGGVPSTFRILQEVLNAASSSCSEPFLLYTAAGGQTFFAPTDEAFEELFLNLNRGLEELLSNPTLLCSLIRYHLTIPCGAQNNALWRRSCGFLTTSDLVDSQALETLFNDATLTGGLGLSGVGTASSLLFAQISQDVSLRKVRVDGYLKRGADVVFPNIVLCGGNLVVHVVSTVLVPAAAFYSSVESLMASSPELSITAEAYFLTRTLRESFVTPTPLQDQGVTAQQQAIIIPPLLPRGSLPLPLLPDSGSCFPGEAGTRLIIDLRLYSTLV